MYVQGIAFSMMDQDGVPLISIDWTAPQLPTPATQSVYVLDLSGVGIDFLLQKYEIFGSIKDQDGAVYSTTPVQKSVCKPAELIEDGYVPGMFQLIPDCINNKLSVKDLTVLAYNGMRPLTTTKSGTLYYPTGTISPVTFTGTPFENNVIYTGQYRINNTTVSEYNLEDDFYVDITYLTNCPFDVTCANRMADILCCIEDVQNTAVKECNNANGARAKNLLSEIAIPLMSGFIAESNGQDASKQVAFIKKSLSCNCGFSSLKQNEFTPINPTVYSIIVQGVNAASVSSSMNGSTQTFTINVSNVSIAKGNTGDLAFAISVDNSTPGSTKYKITFNYTTIAKYVLDAITSNPSLVTELNSLISTTANVDLTNLDGKCIINLSDTNYFMAQRVPNNAATVKNIIIGSTTYTAPGGLLVSNTDGIEAWLNGLSLGLFDASYSNESGGAYVNILTISNANNPVSVTFTINENDTTTPFQKTNKSLISVLQAIIDYLCQLSALQIALGRNLGICYFDYSGNLVTASYSTTNKQDDFNQGVSSAICSIASRIKTITGITCSALAAIFQDYPNLIWGASSRAYGTDGNGNCVSWSDLQFSTMVMKAINKYPTVKSLFCAISCAAPATCPDIATINVAMSGSNIAIFGASFTSVPNAVQSVTVKYRLQSSSTWIVAITNLQLFPNGNISGTSPFLIPGVSLGSTYQIQVVNNCGGVGAIQNFTTPSSGFYSQQYRYNNVAYLLCGTSPVTLYTSTPFGVGVIMYTDMALTTPLTGFVYFADPTGAIWSINSTTGKIQYPLGTNCNSGTAGSYILGNSTGTICASSSSVLYTNGGFAVGDILYIDPALATPVQTYSYVVFNGIIYNLNITTGQIISSTGISCTSAATLTMSYIAGEWTAALNNALPFSITLSSISATGYSNGSCSTPSGESDTLTSTSIISGNTSINQTNSGVTCSSPYYKLGGTVTVNGNVVANGGTVVISGVTITVVINNIACSPYPC